jgi:hypothetical protein
VAMKLINGRLYYFSPMRVDGKVVHLYGGPITSDQARLLMAADRLIREGREARREAEDVAIRGIVERDRPLAAWHALVELAYVEALDRAGFHRHQRQWRKRRMAGSKGTTPAQTNGTPPATAPREYTHAQVRRIAARAEKGDRKAEEEFRQVLRTDRWKFLINTLGNSAVLLEDRLIGLISGPAGLARGAAMEQALVRLRRELTPPDPAPLERLLVERVAVSWLALHVAEFRASSGSHAPRVYDVMQRAVDRCNRRFLSAARALRDFRRLDIRTVVLAQANVEATVGKADP